jgi:S-adenosylmethionine decarboxylase proenzyme
MIKTCGTTTLLKTIPKLLEWASQLGLEVEYVRFSRKNFVFPHLQVYPHTSWSEEVAYMEQYFQGNAYVVGPLTGDHWYMYIADYSNQVRASAPSKDRWIEIMMHKLSRDAASRFYKQEHVGDRDKFPGVIDLVPGQITDEFNFTPCGYSMNGMADDTLSTIHVTPEAHCSYASFETNMIGDSAQYRKMFQSVAEIFKPEVFTAVVFYEHDSHILENGQEWSSIAPGYVCKQRSVTLVDGRRGVLFLSFQSKAALQSHAAALAAKTAQLKKTTMHLSHHNNNMHLNHHHNNHNNNHHHHHAANNSAAHPQYYSSHAALSPAHVSTNGLLLAPAHLKAVSPGLISHELDVETVHSD